MNLFKVFAPVKKKELGLPVGVQWQYVNGIFVPYDNLDSVFIDKGFKAISIIQSLVTKIAEKAADATPQVMSRRKVIARFNVECMSSSLTLTFDK